jgi:hypothetical protein
MGTLLLGAARDRWVRVAVGWCGGATGGELEFDDDGGRRLNGGQWKR